MSSKCKYFALEDSAFFLTCPLALIGLNWAQDGTGRGRNRFTRVLIPTLLFTGHSASSSIKQSYNLPLEVILGIK